MAGLLHRRPDGTAVIGVNALESETRQRFTIAHEIGHLVLHDAELHVDEDFGVRFRDARSGQAVDAAEIEANQFASHLLMPAAFLRKDVRAHAVVDLDDSETIEQLARKYGVSVQAMTFRLAKLFEHDL